MIANRSSPMVSFRAGGWAPPPSKGAERAGEELGEFLVETFRPFGRHLRTASTEARHGWT